MFWKQWHFPVKTRGRNMGEDEDDMMGGGVGGDYFNPLFEGEGGGREGGRAEAAAAEREFESSDRRPWTDLIPRFRVKVEPMTTLKLRKRFYPFKTVIELGADYNTQVWREGWEGGKEGKGRISGGCLAVTRRELMFSKTSPLPPSIPPSLPPSDWRVAIQVLVGRQDHRWPAHGQGEGAPVQQDVVGDPWGSG